MSGLKFDTDKPEVALYPTKVLLEVVKVLSLGKKKYGELNWKKGLSYNRLLSATYRHLFAFQQGEEKDPESDVSHVAHAIANLTFLLYFILSNRKELDDRWEKDNT